MVGAAGIQQLTRVDNESGQIPQWISEVDVDVGIDGGIAEASRWGSGDDLQAVAAALPEAGQFKLLGIDFGNADAGEASKQAPMDPSFRTALLHPKFSHHQIGEGCIDVLVQGCIDPVDVGEENVLRQSHQRIAQTFGGSDRHTQFPEYVQQASFAGLASGAHQPVADVNIVNLGFLVIDHRRGQRIKIGSELHAPARRLFAQHNIERFALVDVERLRSVLKFVAFDLDGQVVNSGRKTLAISRGSGKPQRAIFEPDVE